MKEIATEISATQPFRALISAAGRTRLGRSILTRLAPQRGVYSSLQEAWHAAGRNRHAGHEHPEAVDRHVVLSSDPLPSDYAVLYWLRRLSGSVRVFDFGGNMGNVFYSCIRYLDPAKVEWIVYDLPRVIQAAREMADDQSGLRPAFTTSIADAAGANVLLVSGAYHYWERSTSDFLDQFPRLPEHVFVNRSPFYRCDCQPVISMQGTLNFAFPIIIRSEGELLAGFASRGYDLVDRWTAAEYGHVMPFFPDQSVRRYSGFYFRLKTAPA